MITEYTGHIMDLTLTAAWSIELSSDHPTARYAAEELRRTLQRIGAPALPIVAQAGGPRIALRHGPVGDGFLRAAESTGLLLRGEGPRGLLYAVYALLESLGCRWVTPDPSSERLPRLSQIILPDTTEADRPALPGRWLIVGHDLFLADAEDWIVWAAHNRLSGVFIHTIDRGPALGACRMASWRRHRRKLLPLIAERGLDLALGGHHLSDLIPRRLFRDQPEIFRYDGVRRTPDYNFCPSHPDAQALLRRNGAAFFRAYPEAQIYHLWPDDILGGGWCKCPRCAGLSPADQSLLVANVLAETLAEIRSDASVAYLAYHDTEAAPTRLAPRPNVSLLFAPRPRSYAVGMGAPENSAFARRLDENMRVWAAQRKSATLPTSAIPSSDGATIFEYYLDGILFKSAPPPLPDTIAADLRHYSAAGASGVQALLTGDRPWLVAPPNAYLFARLAWAPHQEPSDILATYATARAPRSPQALIKAYEALAAAWRPALERRPAADQVPPGSPPTDILDFMAEPRPHSEQRLENLRTVEELLAAGRAAWADVLQLAFADRPVLEAELAEWELGANLLNFFTARQQLYVLAQRNASRQALQLALNEARQALATLTIWARQYIPSAAQSNHGLLRMIFQLQLDYLASRQLLRIWQRPVVSARLGADLARLAAADLRLFVDLIAQRRL